MCLVDLVEVGPLLELGLRLVVRQKLADVVAEVSEPIHRLHFIH